MNEPARRPAWSYLIPSRVPALTRRQWDVLGLVVIADMASQYAMSLFVLALPQIQAGLAIPEDQLGIINAYVRFGLIATMFVTAFADRIGRRRMLLFATAGLSLCTLGTAFVANVSQFVIIQTAMRVFLGAEFMLGAVVIVEEFTAADRGWGIGVLATLGALGYGVGAGLFALVDVIPDGWRVLHAVGGWPLLVLPWLARRLPETQRFTDAGRADAGSAAGASLRGALLAPMREIANTRPGRALALATFAFGFEILAWPAFTFVSKHLQDVHTYTPGEISVLFLTAGLLGILGNVVAGTLGDRFGRRPVSVALILLTGASCWVLYRAEGGIVPVAWIGFIFGLTGLNVLLTALSSELFPTSARSTAAGFRMTAAALGGTVGLFLESALYRGSHADAILSLMPGLAAAMIAVWMLPESAGRELEELSGAD